LQRKKLLCLGVAAVCASSASAFASTASAAQITGAGSTLVAPLEAIWATNWAGQTGNSVQFSAIGSGKGITAITQSQVDFGASDAPLNPTQAAACSGCVQIPWALSATGIGYNLPGVRKLHLSGPVLANIYLGSITRWNDPQIAALNKGVSLPATAITPIHRIDGSGDTYAFTNYLTHVSGTWASRVGLGTSVQFPAGPGNSGNLGVQTTLSNTAGGIAYIATSYLLAHGDQVAAVRNAAGKYEYPNLVNIENAAHYVRSVPANNAISIVNPPKKAKIAYPISTFTYVIARPGNALVKSFITYALGGGQKLGRSLDFAPMPAGVLRAAKATLGRL
jgi:phosphate transport system substrate-binding protein